MPTSSNRPADQVQFALAVGVIVLVYGTLLVQYGTQQPGHSGGPFVLLWVSIPTMALAGVILGKQLSQRVRTRGRVRTASVQLVVSVLLFTPVTVVVWLFDPGYLEWSIAGGWYGILVGLSVVLISVSHLLSYVLNDVLTVQPESG